MKYLIGGGHETYCRICGAPTNNIGIYTIKDLKNKKLVNSDLPDSWYVNVHKESDYPNLEIIKLEDNKKYWWLSDLVLLTPSGKNVKIIPVDTWERRYEDKNGKLYNIFGRLDNEEDGYLLHKDCYKLIKSKIGNFNLYNLDESQKINNMDLIKKYMLQDVRWLSFFLNQEDYLLESPLKNKKNKSRILSLKHNLKKDFFNLNLLKLYYQKQLKYIKKNPKLKINIIPSLLKLVESKKSRPSPSDSATKFKEGTKKKGNDGNMYIVVVNKNSVKRWVKIKKNNF